jgi:hypothetical protein
VCKIISGVFEYQRALLLSTCFDMLFYEKIHTPAAQTIGKQLVNKGVDILFFGGVVL